MQSWQMSCGRAAKLRPGAGAPPASQALAESGAVTALRGGPAAHLHTYLIRPRCDPELGGKVSGEKPRIGMGQESDQLLMSGHHEEKRSFMPGPSLVA